MGRIILLCAAALVLTAIAAQSASPIYVDATRPDDSGDGTSWATAKETIQAGINAVDAGGTVIVRASGTYIQSATLLIAKSLTLQAEFADTKPVVQLIPGSGSARGVTINSSDVTVQNLNLIQTGSSGDPSILYVPKLTHTFPAPGTFQYSNISIIGCILDGSRRAGYITAENLTVQDCVFKNQVRDCLYLDGVKGGTITGCHFSGTSNKAIIVENTSDGPYSSGLLDITHNTCVGKANFFLFDNFSDESSQFSLNVSHNSIAGTTSSVIVLFPVGASSTIWNKLASVTIRDNAITNAGGMAAYVDYSFYTGTSVPAVGAFGVDHCLGYSNTVRVGDTADPSGNYGFTSGYPPGTTMAMYSLANNLAVSPLWADPAHASDNFEFLLGSPLENAASDSTNIGAWQGHPSVDSITPSSGLDNGTVSITDLAGSGFAAGAIVKLTKSAQADIVATSVVVATSTKITCDFDLTGKANGFWNVVVTNVGGNPVSLNNAFEVTASALPPVADAGPDQTIATGPVTLDGSGSHDPDSLPLTYVWKEGLTQIATGVNPTVPISHGQHIITLTVTNTVPLSDSDDTTILVDRPPAASGQSVTATGGTPRAITLVATDPDGDALTYHIDTPPSHGTLTGAAPNVVYHNTPGYTGPDSFTFHASDPWLNSNIATVGITVGAPQAPVANAGPDQIVPVGPVTLNGSGSHDPQSLPLISYVWKEGVTQIATGVNPTVVMAHGQHLITLTVTNSELLTGSDNVAVLVDRPPVAADQSTTTFVGTPAAIALHATDPDGDPLTYQIVARPAHGILSGTPPNVIYTPATYVGLDPFTFRANDGWLNSNVATVSVDLQLRINCGGPTVANWMSDRTFVGGGAIWRTSTIAGAGSVPVSVYQTQRTGAFSYNIPGSNGQYTVRLCFAEIEFSSARTRLFDVYIENRLVLSNFDIFAAAGGKNKAVVREFPTTVSDNNGIQIRFVPRKLNAAVAGIEVL